VLSDGNPQFGGDCGDGGGSHSNSQSNTIGIVVADLVDDLQVDDILVF
jgi:hypothetical protein